MNQLQLIMIAIIVSGAAFWGGQGIGYANGYNASQADHVAALAEAEAKNLELERQLVRSVEEVAKNAEFEREKIADRLADANDAVDRLRRVIRDTDASSDSGTTSGTDAASARALLADCAARYRDMARTADQLRANVISLQGYARSIMKLNESR